MVAMVTSELTFISRLKVRFTMYLETVERLIYICRQYTRCIIVDMSNKSASLSYITSLGKITANSHIIIFLTFNIQT